MEKPRQSKYGSHNSERESQANFRGEQTPESYSSSEIQVEVNKYR